MIAGILGTVTALVVLDEYNDQRAQAQAQAQAEAQAQAQAQANVQEAQAVVEDIDTTQHIQVTQEGERDEQSPYVRHPSRKRVVFDDIPTSSGSESVALRFDHELHKGDRNISHILNMYAADEALSGIPGNKSQMLSNRRNPNHFDKRRLDNLTGDRPEIEQVRAGSRPNIFGGYDQNNYGQGDPALRNELRFVEEQRNIEALSLVRQRDGRAPFEQKILRGANKLNPLSTGIDTPRGEAQRFRERKYTASGAGVAFLTPDISGGIAHRGVDRTVYKIPEHVQKYDATTIEPITWNVGRKRSRPSQNKLVSTVPERNKIADGLAPVPKSDIVIGKGNAPRMQKYRARTDKHAVTVDPMSFRQVPRGDRRIRTEQVDTRTKTRLTVNERHHKRRLMSRTARDIEFTVHKATKKEAVVADASRLQMNRRGAFARSTDIARNLSLSTDTSRRYKGVDVVTRIRNNRVLPMTTRPRQIMERTVNKIPIHSRRQTIKKVQRVPRLEQMYTKRRKSSSVNDMRQERRVVRKI